MAKSFKSMKKDELIAYIENKEKVLKPTSIKKSHSICAGDIREGGFVLVPYWTKVSNDKTFLLKDEVILEDVFRNMDKFTVRGKDLIERCLSSDLFYEEVKRSATEIIDILTSSHNMPLSVCYRTAKDPNKDRVLRGRFVRTEWHFGRSYCQDFDVMIDKKKSKDDGMRLVDHRTIKWLVVDGTKYIVK